MKGFFQIMLIVLITKASFASGDHHIPFSSGDLGEMSWHFYGNKPKKAPDLHHQALGDLSDEAAIRAVRMIKKRYQASLDRALLAPTHENIQKAQAMHLYITKLSTNFQQAWDEAYLLHMPAFVRVEQPVTQYGRLKKHDREADDLKAAVDVFNQAGGLIYFYKSSCPYCQQFSPILKDFVRLHHLHLKAVSCDGVASPDFKDSRLASPDLCAQFDIQKTPTVVAVKPHTNQRYFLSIGLVSHEMLAQNLLKILQGRRF